MNKKILITPRSLTEKGHPILDRLRHAGYELILSAPGQQPDEAELMLLLPGCAGYLAGVEKITARVLAAAKDLRVISRNGTGVDNVDLAAAERLGVKVCRAEGANARGVAELALALIFALVRSLPFSDQGLKQGAWLRRQGVELEGRCLGLLGCGKIGKIVAGFGAALGMRVLAYDLFPEWPAAPQGFRFGTFEEVLTLSDIISLHCPAAGGAKPLIGRNEIAQMQKGIYLVNTARAGLLDETALLEALETKHVAGFATDVFSQEPPGESALIKHQRVIATPHIGGFTKESVARATEVAVENLIAALNEKH